MMVVGRTVVADGGEDGIPVLYICRTRDKYKSSFKIEFSNLITKSMRQYKMNHLSGFYIDWFFHFMGLV